MNQPEKRVVLVTGASSGIGRACALYLKEKGYIVYGTSRSGRVADEGSSKAASTIRHLVMDVNSDASVTQAIETIAQKEGHIDVVINCAGYGIGGAVEDTSISEAKAQLETNFFGTMRVCQAVLPMMRKQRRGYIINISSISGLIGIPFQGLYSASKFALEGLTETLRMEVKGYGVKVVLIEPGDYNTGFTANRVTTGRAKEGSIYRENFQRAIQVMEEDEMKGPSPVKIAQLVDRILKKKSPRLRYVTGPVFEHIAIVLKKLLPQKVFEWALSKYYKVDGTGEVSDASTNQDTYIEQN